MNDIQARLTEFLNDIRTGQISRVLMRSADFGLVGALAIMVALMIVPLPTWLLDIFLSINITGALVILMVSVYIPGAVQIATFPSLLLLTTLYRLSLDISTTRLILLHADAGEVVGSFGQFVVQGNYVVGAVIFLIITLVQFIVITKGAERVAEVGARFTLDAMPGKQMSIDADMRAGIINYDQARAKRDMLARESQFYGAMDGAMKFVKGDAIAGIVITLINIVAGLIIGVAMQGMQAGEAAQVYSVLTIGSGLVSQIPALLISIAAGIVTTRSGSGADSADTNLGSQVVGQLIAQPKAITLAAGLVFILALVPGLPKIPFFLLSITVGLAGWKMLNPTPQKAETELDEEIAVGPEQEAAEAKLTAGDPFKQAAKGTGELPMVQPTVPLAVRVGKGLFPLLRDFQKQWGELAAARFFDLGVPFPPVPIAVGNDLADDAFEVRLNETPALSGNIRLDCHLVPESPLPLASFRIDGVEGRNPLNGRQASWIPSGQAPQAAAAGFTTWDPVGVLKLHLTSFLRRNAAEFLGLQQVHEMVEGMRAHYPNLVEQTVPKPVPVHLLAEVLRGLVREQVSIRDMRTIFESLAQHGRSEQDVEELVEWVRRDLRQRLCHQLSSGGPTLLVTGLSTRFAEGFRLSIRRGPSGSTINLPHKMLEEFLAAARRAFSNLPSTAQVPVLVCDLDIRVWVRRMLSSQFPEVSVVAYEQLSPKLSITMLRELD